MATTSSRSATVTLPTDEQILITRTFDAPKHLVYRAYTTPELVRRWWHAKRGTVTVAEIDPRVGGAWRFVMVTGDGLEVAFHGEYREIVPDERLVTTELYEGAPDVTEDDATVNTTTFAQADGRTTLTTLVECRTQEIRDLIVEINRQGTAVLLVEQNATMALSIASHGYVMETGKLVMDAPAAQLLADDDVREFYLGLQPEGDVKSFRDVKHYRRRKRWLS